MVKYIVQMAPTKRRAKHASQSHFYATTNGVYRWTASRCDGQLQCRDSSDEAACTQCKEHLFKCSDGLCIPDSKRCDLNTDCVDGSDEINCESCKNNSNFHCIASRTCHPMSAFCDGNIDCPDHTDEFFSLTTPSGTTQAAFAVKTDKYFNLCSNPHFHLHNTFEGDRCTYKICGTIMNAYDFRTCFTSSQTTENQ